MRDVQNSFTSGSQEKFVYSISTGAKDFPPYLKRVSTLYFAKSIALFL